MTAEHEPLHGLDEVPWEELTHAYGAAVDVPRALRAFLHSPEEAADAYSDTLVGSLWHQGDVFPATVAALPFLISLAAAQRVFQRGALVVTLVLVAADASRKGGALREPILRNFRERRATLAELGRRYPVLREALEHVDMVAHAASPPLYDHDEVTSLIDTLEDIELDPPAGEA